MVIWPRIDAAVPESGVKNRRRRSVDLMMKTSVPNTLSTRHPEIRQGA